MLLEKPLETPRLHLRSLHPGDASGPYLGWMADPDLLRFLEVRHDPPQGEQDLSSFIAACNVHPTVLLLGICTLDGRHIGNVKLGASDPHHKRADIGFLVGDRAAWGQGLASEAVDRLAAYAFESVGLTKVVAGCYRANLGGARVLEKAKFAHEATLRSHWYLDGAPHDGLLFARHPAGVPL